MTEAGFPSVEEIAAEVVDRAPGDGLGARLLLASLVTTLAGRVEVSLLVVGGTAVDTYVSGGMGTSEELPAGWEESRDIDTIAVAPLGGDARGALRDVLEAAGFRVSEAGGAIRRPGLPFAIDLVGTRIDDDYSREHLVQVQEDGWQAQGLAPVTLVGPEDLLFDYMESAVDTRHQRDWTRALAIVAAMGEHLDLGYLYTKAHWRREGRFVPWLDQLMAGEPLEPEASKRSI